MGLKFLRSKTSNYENYLKCMRINIYLEVSDYLNIKQYLKELDYCKLSSACLTITLEAILMQSERLKDRIFSPLLLKVSEVCRDCGSSLKLFCNCGKSPVLLLRDDIGTPFNEF